jgi:hypothetical protein
VKEIASGRLGLVAAKYGEHAPMATACCNACRSCVTANVVSLATAAVVASAVSVRRLFRRNRLPDADLLVELAGRPLDHPQP